MESCVHYQYNATLCDDFTLLDADVEFFVSETTLDFAAKSNYVMRQMTRAGKI